MFCHNCGTKIESNTKFCGNCGAKTGNVTVSSISSEKAINPMQFQLDISTVINIVISVAMVLAMLILPMFKLSYDPDYKNRYYTISLLGDNYMAGHSIKSDITTFSRITFIIMIASVIALIFFKLAKKTRLTLISSAINFGILGAYNSYVNYAWMNDASRYDEYSTIIDAGNGLCLCCSLALFILSLRQFIKEKKNI